MKILTLVVVLIEAVLFLLSSLAPPLVSWGSLISEFELVFYSLLLIGFYVSTSLFLLKSELTSIEDETRTGVQRIIDSKGLVEAIGAEEFHERFRRHATFAKSAVLMSHLDTEPPRKKGPTGSYFSNLESLIKGNSSAEFIRVERLSPEKIEWVQELISSLGSEGNFSLYVLNVDGPQKLPHVSVQVIDERVSALVAVHRHSAAGSKRDIWIEDRDTARMWAEYFRAFLVNNSNSIVKNGYFDESEWDALRSQYE